MAEFRIISNLLRETCDENEETQKLCKQIASKYMENEKKKLRAQSALEENIRLKLEVGNLESTCRTVIQNDEAQAELHSLLKEYYEEHLKATFDIDECEMEKLFSYEEIKIELETRDSIALYQQFYWRKINIATKMEERKIVKTYRRIEKELLKSEDERLKLEETIKKLKEKADESKARMKELLECIYRLVKGSKDLDAMYARQKPYRHGPQNENLKQAGRSNLFGNTESRRAPNQALHKGGFSSRLALNFNQFQTPFVPVLSKIHTINPSMGLNRLLQQAEVLRKSMQRNVIPLPDDPPTPKLSSILKTPTEFSNPSENSHKTVSFEVDIAQETKVSENISDTPPCVAQITLDTTISEITVESEVKKNFNTKVQPKKEKIEVLENIIIKPADTLLPFQLHVEPAAQLQKEEHSKKPVDPKLIKKRKAVEEVHSYTTDSPPKKTLRGPEKLDSSMDIGSKSFMDMFLDFSKQQSTVSSFIPQPSKKPVQDVQMNSETKDPLKKIKVNAKKIEEAEDKNVEKNKSRKHKATSDDFEDFFAGLAGNTSDNNDNDLSGADMSFDFFEGNGNDEDDAASDNFSFKF